MPRRESTARNFLVTAVVAVVCSAAVSVTAIGLRARRGQHADLSRMRHVLEAAGRYDPDVPVAYAFRDVEARVVDLETGAYVPEERYDPTVKDPIPAREDIAELEKRERYQRVYLFRELGEVQEIVLPVRGQGWSMLHAFVALDRDLATIRGFTVYEHDETAGMGAEVDNPKWKAGWPDKRVFDPKGDFRLLVGADGRGRGEPASLYRVDGITGATLTTEGLDNMMRFWFSDQGYGRYLARLREKGVDHG